jgi:hypothetical protein
MIRVYDRAKPGAPRPCGALGVAFDSGKSLGAWEFKSDFAARYPPCVCPCPRFGHVLTGVSTGLGVIVGG